VKVELVTVQYREPVLKPSKLKMLNIVPQLLKIAELLVKVQSVTVKVFSFLIAPATLAVFLVNVELFNIKSP
jgi:hypothetical protein